MAKGGLPGRIRAGAVALLAFVVGPLLLLAAPSAAAAEKTTTKVVVVAVPDLRWADLADMPVLRRFATGSAVADLSVKTAGGTPRCPDGALTFSAGTRVNATGSDRACAIAPGLLPSIRAEARESKFAAVVGAFGQALHDHGYTTAAVGADAEPLVADVGGDVDVRAATFAAALGRATVVATVVDPLYYAPGVDRANAARLTDQRLAPVLAAVPAGATTVVAGISDGDDTAMHLHTLLVHGPGWRHVELRSPSTHPPYVQLRDLAPTILSMLDVPVPASMVGAPAVQTSIPAAAPAAYAGDDDHAVTARAVGRVLRTVFAEVALFVVLLLVASHRAPSPWRDRCRATAIVVGALSVTAPAMSFLVQVLPWWHWPTVGYALLVPAGSVAVGVVALAVRRRRGTAAALAVGPAVTAAILIGDQLAGAPLQLSAPLGDNPIVAGRFHGMGNTDFALMCTSMVLLAGLAGGRLQRLGRRNLGLVVAGGLVVLAIVVDAAPPLGDDFGGILTMGPVLAFLLLLLGGVRLSWRRVVAVVVAAAAAAVGVALVDYARPPADQTHVGRFVGQVLHGGAGAVLHRKIDAAAASFGNAALSSLVAVVVVAVILFRHELAAALRRVPGLPAATVAAGVLAVLGTLLNDSGVVVAATAVQLAAWALAGAGVFDRHRAAPAEDNGADLAPVADRSRA